MERGMSPVGKTLEQRGSSGRPPRRPPARALFSRAAARSKALLVQSAARILRAGARRSGFLERRLVLAWADTRGIVASPASGRASGLRDRPAPRAGPRRRPRHDLVRVHQGGVLSRTVRACSPRNDRTAGPCSVVTAYEKHVSMADPFFRCFVSPFFAPGVVACSSSRLIPALAARVLHRQTQVAQRVRAHLLQQRLAVSV